MCINTYFQVKGENCSYKIIFKTNFYLIVEALINVNSLPTVYLSI